MKKVRIFIMGVERNGEPETKVYTLSADDNANIDSLYDLEEAIEEINDDLMPEFGGFGPCSESSDKFEDDPEELDELKECFNGVTPRWSENEWNLYIACILSDESEFKETFEFVKAAAIGTGATLEKEEFLSEEEAVKLMWETEGIDGVDVFY
jgi:hypothetical protein